MLFCVDMSMVLWSCDCHVIMQVRGKSTESSDSFTVMELVSTMTNLIPPFCKNLEDIIEYFQVKEGNNSCDPQTLSVLPESVVHV